MSRLRWFTIVLCAAAGAAAPALAFVAPAEPTRFDHLVLYDPPSRMGLTAERPENVPGFDLERAGWEDFRKTHGPGWAIYVDPRSGAPTLVEGQGVKWSSADGPQLSAIELESRARAFVDANRALFKVDGAQLALNPASGAVDKDHSIVIFDRVFGGVPVENQRFILYVTRGALVSFGADRWGVLDQPIEPIIDRDYARELLLAYMELLPEDHFHDVLTPRLVYVSAPSEDSGAYAGPVGGGVKFHLTWRFAVRVLGERGTWIGKVDATTGQVIAFYDDDKYAQVKGGVYPVSNDGRGWDGTEQPGWPMPYADVSLDGHPSTANDMGLFDCSPAGATALTALSGSYVRVYDNCGAVSETATCEDDIDLAQGSGTDCTVPPGSSAGDTHSSRSCFYHLNRAMEKGRAWLPSNSWLASQLTSNVNINSTCNAYWNGTVNFYKSGGGCRNTGEIAGVFVHEWGHGIDQNDGGGYDNPSEAYADAVAFIQTHVSCVGRGFFADDHNCSGYGDACLNCSGIRDQDWDQHASHSPATPQGFAKNNCSGGGGPCGREEHCESYIGGQAIWDLAARDLPAAGLDQETAWQLTDKLFYKSRNGSGGAAYNCNLTTNTSDGCGAGTWFTKFRNIDDDDGNLNNGTPHAAAIFAAFSRHNIACGAANDASNQNSSSCPTVATPTLSGTAGSNAANLSWTAVPGAATYQVLRNDQGCNTAHTIIATVPAPTTSYVDTDLPNGFPVYYAIQAQTSNTACESALSNCVSVAPQPFAGTVKLDQATYGCSNLITVSVLDANVGASSTTATIASATEATPETLILNETAPGSARYVATIQTTSAPAAHGDGLLSIAHGDVITARYTDADDGQGGVNLLRQTTATGDCVFPVVSQVQAAGATDVAATITWSTDEISTSAVHWGPVKPPANTTSATGYTTAHSVALTNLQPCTVYYYSVESRDRAGNVVDDRNSGAYYRFETLKNFGSGLQSCHAGKVILPRPNVGCLDSLEVRLSDIDENHSSTTVDSITVDVTSTTEPTPETLTLVETNANSSTFVATIPTRSGTAISGDGILQIADRDTLTATYHDADDGVGARAVSFATGTGDCTAPSYTSVQVKDVTDESATIRWTTSEPSTSRVDWGSTPALGSVASNTSLVTDHAISLQPLLECGRYYFRVSSTDALGYTSTIDAGGSPFAFSANLIPGVFRDNFESAAGWTLEGEWQIGAPAGLGTSPGDPATAYEGSKVLGHDLSGLGAHAGDYEPNTTQSARSPIINCTGLTNTEIKFRRRLNVNGANGAKAAITVKRGYAVYPPAWSTTSSSESGWSTQTLNIAQFADGADAVQISFDQIGGAGPATAAGWTIDRFIVRSAGMPAYDACGGCTGAPTFGGATSAIDANPCAATGVTLTWMAAPAWGTGRAGTYSIHRSADPVFAPSASNRIAAGVTGTSWTDASAPNNTTLYYIVRAENNETCSTGPNNGGVVDGNLVRVSAIDQTTQPTPPGLASLLAGRLNDAHVRLSWLAVPNGAAYHVHRGAAPLGSFPEIGTTAAIYYDDLNQLGNTTNWFYFVNPADACGNETP